MPKQGGDLNDKDQVELFPHLTQFFATQISNYLPLQIEKEPVIKFLKVYGKRLKRVRITSVQGIEDETEVMPLLNEHVLLTISTVCSEGEDYTFFKNEK